MPCEALAGAAKVAQPPADLFKVPAQGSLRLPVTVNAVIPGGLVPAGASAVVVNVTATAATGAGFVQVIATGGSTGLGASSNLNVEQAGQTIANLSIVPIGADGTITIYAQAGAHLVVDVAGYFTGTGAPASTGGLFVPVDPTRLIDTRTPPATKPGPGTPVVVTAGGVGGIPTSGVAAVFLNVTITDAEAPGYVTVYPGGVALPTVSNVNAERAGQTKPNAAFTGLGTGGVFNLYTQTGDRKSVV